MELEATLSFMSNREIFIEMMKLLSYNRIAVKTTAAVLNSRENL